jgi:outer membrane protein assembly factor BamB
MTPAVAREQAPPEGVARTGRLFSDMKHSISRVRIASSVTAAVALVGVATLSAATHARAADWPTFNGNASRSAWLNADRSIDRHNVQSLHVKWVAKLDAVADSTPIFVKHIRNHAGKVTAMLFQTDHLGTTYGIDAGSGSILWRFRTSGPKITDSTPALDPAGSAIYVPGVDGYVHKVDAATGSELQARGFPVQITLMPDLEKDASPLNVANGYLYAATSGYFGDAPPYDGHVVAVRLSDGKTNVFNSLCSHKHKLLTGSDCSSVRSGIWARAGVVVDPDASMSGRVYFASGNGPFAPTQDYGDSAVALSADGRAFQDSFTPSNYVQLQDEDLDLGSTAPAILPAITKSLTPLMAVQGGKGQVLDLLDRTHMGGVGGELQSVSLPTELFTAPAVWRDDSGLTQVFLGLLPGRSEVMALTLKTDGQGHSRLRPAWTATVGGTSPVVINGIVLVAASGVLSALDSRTGSVLWSSTSPSAGGTIGSIHWQSPIAVDGGVYISDGAGNLTAYTAK